MNPATPKELNQSIKFFRKISKCASSAQGSALIAVPLLDLYASGVTCASRLSRDGSPDQEL
jgi:hypothetical protein